MTEIIPAIDLIDGRCVRLTQGDYNAQKVYDQQPTEIARMVADCGVKRLHVVDLDGAKAKAPCNLKVLEQLAALDILDIEWGGGIKSGDALRQTLEAGASRVICGSVAVDGRELFASWLQAFGNERIILGADVRDKKVATHGWLKDSGVDLFELVEGFLPSGLSQLICTDISKDGTLQGPNFELYSEIMERFPEIYLTLSGGVASTSDLYKAREMEIDAVIVGKAMYEGKITLDDIEKYYTR